jgi:probable phosphoglycerate mutase
MMTDYTIIFDGGSLNNGSPDSHGYGSYQLNTRTGRSEIKRLRFGTGVTNNQAEYGALLGAVKDLADRILEADRQRSEFTLEIKGDSQLVLNQMAGKWKVKDPELAKLWNEAHYWVEDFNEVLYTYTPREEIVRVLGH